ncbi:hypothetical protein RZO55_08820 [Clostridium boliviensis]|uniref:DUF2007 domain-containing protein n=1 Tax=Clostridium boliviensis TaxID=318465 RepID=A0ABU4GJ85_9CLOT|nr:hypothetical protein [Clostridium boliviensis]MDW2797674.1 hypothetical protein [Clostridium boliviensis]
MLFKKKLVEIYSTQDLEKLYQVKNKLRENDIYYMTETTNNSLRLSMNNLNGRNPILGRTGNVKNFYRLFVYKKDQEKAAYFLSQLN